MSRSYRKEPVVTDGKVKSTQESKKFANKKVRNREDIPTKGGGYKKVSESYDIHDFSTRWTWAEAKADYESDKGNSYLKKRYPTLKSYYRWWVTNYKYK
jgi:hypothetical protein